MYDLWAESDKHFCLQEEDRWRNHMKAPAAKNTFSEPISVSEVCNYWITAAEFFIVLEDTEKAEWNATTV